MYFLCKDEICETIGERFAVNKNKYDNFNNGLKLDKTKELKRFRNNVSPTSLENLTNNLYYKLMEIQNNLFNIIPEYQSLPLILFRNQVLSLELYYDSLTYFNIAEQEAYNVSSLIYKL